MFIIYIHVYIHIFSIVSVEDRTLYPSNFLLRFPSSQKFSSPSRHRKSETSRRFGVLAQLDSFITTSADGKHCQQRSKHCICIVSAPDEIWMDLMWFDILTSDDFWIYVCSPSFWTSPANLCKSGCAALCFLPVNQGNFAFSISIPELSAFSSGETTSIYECFQVYKRWNVAVNVNNVGHKTAVIVWRCQKGTDWGSFGCHLISTYNVAACFSMF